MTLHITSFLIVNSNEDNFNYRKNRNKFTEKNNLFLWTVLLHNPFWIQPDSA